MKEKIFKEWKRALLEFSKGGSFFRLSEGDSGLAQYKGILLETFHQAGVNPQIQAFCTLYFKNNPRKMIDLFYKHAISEIGHDMLAHNDLVAMGVASEDIIKSKPLPTTLALNSYIIYQIQFVNPISYLGYLFHLEFFPTTSGGGIMEMLGAAGVPDHAMSFLKEHSTVDIGHNKLMEKYLEHFVRDEVALESVIDTAIGTCQLHLLMMEKAMENGERKFRK